MAIDNRYIGLVQSANSRKLDCKHFVLNFFSMLANIEEILRNFQHGVLKLVKYFLRKYDNVNINQQTQD